MFQARELMEEERGQAEEVSWRVVVALKSRMVMTSIAEYSLS